MTEEMKQMTKLLRKSCIADTLVSEGELRLNTLFCVTIFMFCMYIIFSFRLSH